MRKELRIYSCTGVAMGPGRGNLRQLTLTFLVLKTFGQKRTSDIWSFDKWTVTLGIYAIDSDIEMLEKAIQVF